MYYLGAWTPITLDCRVYSKVQQSNCNVPILQVFSVCIYICINIYTKIVELNGFLYRCTDISTTGLNGFMFRRCFRAVFGG